MPLRNYALIISQVKCPAHEDFRGQGMSLLGTRLVDQLETELEFSRIEGPRNRAKVAGSHVQADATVIGITLELRMVPSVEGIRAELDAAASLFTDDKVLEERQVPVVAARTA
jgi:hypothetical protein